MRRCAKCNRTFQTDTQKFCTHDGGLLFAIDSSLSETVQFDSTKIRDAVSKPTTRDLADQKPAAFDPEATVVTGPPAEVVRRDTGELQSPQPPQQISAATVVSGPIEPARPSAPLPSATPPPVQPTSAPL